MRRLFAFLALVLALGVAPAFARPVTDEEAAERKDEEDAGDEIEQGGEIRAHGHSSSGVVVWPGNSTPTNCG